MNNTPICLFWSSAAFQSSIHLTRSVWQLWPFRKALKSLSKIDMKWSNNWSFIVDSYNFDSVVNMLTGLLFPLTKLSDFLILGLTSASFMFPGKISLLMQLFIKEVRGLINPLCARRRIFPGLSSYPVAFFMSIDFSLRLISSWDTGQNVNGLGSLRCFLIWMALGCLLCFWIAASTSTVPCSKPIEEAIFAK